MRHTPSFDYEEIIKDYQVLLMCLSLKDQNFALGKISDISPETWQTVYRQSLEHNVTPLLYDRLLRSGNYEFIPRKIWEQYHLVYLTALSRNLRLYSQLSDVLRWLNSENIPVIVLKGAHLAEKVYKDIALRTFDDVDLMFLEKDLSKCDDTFFETVGRRGSGELLIDIQWNIDLSMANLPIKIDGLWKRSRRTDIAGVDTFVLCPEDLLLHLCLHVAFHHRFESMGLRALCDIRQTVLHFKHELDWHGLTQRAKRWGVSNAVGLTLTLANDLLGAEIPTEVLNILNPSSLNHQPLQWAVRQVFLPSRSTSSLSSYFWAILKPANITKKVTYLRRLILPSRSHILQKYSNSTDSKSMSSFYEVHLKKNLKRYVKSLIKIHKRNENIMHEMHQEFENIDMMEWLAG